MQLSSAVRNGMFTTVLVIGAAHLALAQSAAEILKKTNAVYTGAKTYQATMEMNMSMGSMGSMTTVTEIKSIGNSKVCTKTSSQGAATGQMAMGAGGLSMQMVDDGTTMYTYMPAQNKYFKRPHVAGAGSMSTVMPFVGDPTKGKGNYTLLPATTVDGKPVYAISVQLPAGAGMNIPMFKGMKIVVYIDKNSYHYKQVKVKTNTPAAQGKSMTMDMTMTFKNEKFNAPIPDSVFKFTPPAGATEMNLNGMGMGAMQGGAPGAGH